MPQKTAAPFPLAELAGASVIYGANTVLDNLSWRIMPGEHWAVLGKNGAGKTTLLRLLRGEIRPYFRADGAAPPVRWAIEGPPDASPLAVRPYSSMLSAALQRHYVRQGWRLTGEEVILSGFGDGYMLYDLPSEAEREAVYNLAVRLGAAHLLDALAPDMSQGQLRLVLLARALVKKPRLLLLDEPCDGLDEGNRKNMLGVLDEICGETSIICAIHKGDDIPGCLTHALELEQGKIVGSGPLDREKIFAEPPPARPPGQTRSPGGSQVIFTLKNADVYLKRKKILRGIDWQVKSGENWLLSGPNGAGKSTLLRVLLGEEHVALGGSLTWFGKNTPFTLEERRRYTGYVSDSLRDTCDHGLTGRELVLSGLMGSIGLYRAPAPEEEKEGDFWLAALHLADSADKKLESMSEGAARRFLLARALAPRPRLLILDEPCSGLDSAARAEFMRLVPLATRAGSQIIFVSHSKADRAGLAPLLTHELRLKGGRVEYCGEIVK